MSCAKPEFHERLVELLGAGGTAEAAIAVRQHAAGCAECTAELALLTASWQALEPLRAPAPSEAALERARVAARPLPVPWLPVAGGLAVAAALAYLVGVQPNIFDQPFGLLATVLLAFGYIFGIRAAQSAYLGDPRFWLPAALGVALALLSQPSHTHGPMVCLPITLAASAAPFALAFVAARGGRAGGAGAGALLGGAAALMGLAVVRLHCPAGGVPHALALHFPPVLVAAALGAVAARLLRAPAATS